MLAEQPTRPTVVTDEIIWDLLTEAVEKLGDDPEQIARTFQARGITGECGNAQECPVARYLEAELGDVQPVVLGTRIDVRGTEGRAIAISPTPALSVFVHRFDAERYPALIRVQQEDAA